MVGIVVRGVCVDSLVVRIVVLSVMVVFGSILVVVFFLMIRRPRGSTQSGSSAASDVYKGQGVLGFKIGGFDFELSFNWLLTGLLDIWQPFLLGCFIVGATASLLSFILIRVMWRYHILSHIKNRIKRKNKKFHI